MGSWSRKFMGGWAGNPERCRLSGARKYNYVLNKASSRKTYTTWLRDLGLPRTGTRLNPGWAPARREWDILGLICHLFRGYFATCIGGKIGGGWVKTGGRPRPQPRTASEHVADIGRCNWLGCDLEQLCNECWWRLTCPARNVIIVIIIIMMAFSTTTWVHWMTALIHQLRQHQFTLRQIK